MLGELRRQVDVRERVAVQHEEPLADEPHVGREADGPGRAERLLLDHVAQGDAAVALAQDALHGIREEAAREDRLLHAVAVEPVEHEGEEGPAR